MEAVGALRQWLLYACLPQWKRDVTSLATVVCVHGTYSSVWFFFMAHKSACVGVLRYIRMSSLPCTAPVLLLVLIGLQQYMRLLLVA